MQRQDCSRQDCGSEKWSYNLMRLSPYLDRTSAPSTRWWPTTGWGASRPRSSWCKPMSSSSFSGNSPSSFHRSLIWIMDEGTIKTQNCKCRLYWCLIECIDWRYSQTCWYFRPLLWTVVLLPARRPPPPLPPSLSKRTVCTDIVRLWGGGCWVVL